MNEVTTVPMHARPDPDDELLAAFEAATLPGEAFDHRAHLRVAFLCLAREGDLAAGAARFKRGLVAFTRALGVEAKYHETLTWAYLVLIHEAIAADAEHGVVHPDAGAFLAAHPELVDHRGGLLSRCYDVDAITASQRARTTFVLPRAGGTIR
jgi:hypothetical protein